MTTVFTTNNNNINVGNGLVTCGNINIKNTTNSERGIYWYNRDDNSINSSIYVGNDLVISSDDNVYIKLNQGNFTNGKFFVNGGMVVEKTNAFFNQPLADYGLGTGYRVINRDKTESEQGNLFGNGGTTFPDASYSLVCKGRIACQNEIGVFSDVRIKNNINNIDSIRSLELLRTLQPKTFNYIDDDKNHKLSYGFIAQEVDNAFSDSISKNREVVPNVYSCCSVIQNVFTFKDYSITDLSQNDSIKIINASSTDQTVTIKKILDDHTFTINEKVEDGNYFIYGKYVDDFHVLEKHAIFTLTTSAVKQIDKELQETKRIVASQQTEIDALKTQLNELLILDE